MTESSSDGDDDPSESNPPTDPDFPVEFSLDVRQLTGLVSDQTVALLDPEGRVGTWNESARRLTGYEEDEVVGRHYRLFFPVGRREQGVPERLLERARTEGKAEEQGWRLRNDGSRLWAREVIAPIRTDDVDIEAESDADSADDDDENGDLVGYAWLLHDRTPEYEREQKLREQQTFTESVFAAQPDIVYVFDVEGNYLQWNDRVPEVTGYTEAELAEMEPLEFIAPEHREQIAEAIERILEEDEYVTREADLLTKDGERIPYEFNTARISDDDGTTLGFTGVGRDVSDRKERERELREEKALTESIFEAQPDLLYAYDADGGLIHWNDRLEELTELESDELEGREPLEFIAPPDRDRIAEAIDRIMTEGERVTEEGRLVTGEGEYVPYEFNSARITGEDGAVLGFTGVGRDISDRKARERELERLERLNATIRTIDETMVAAESRDEVESAIVDAFAAAEAYRFAVIGRVDTAPANAERRWEAQAWTGIDQDGAADALQSFADPPTGAGESPLETGRVQCYRNLRDSDVDRWRDHARDREYGAVAVVPIVASGRTFGLLLVAAEKGSAFTDREREVLQEFGGTIGHAINAMIVRRLLYQDTVVELEFESTDRQEICIDLSARLDCRLSLEHVLSLTDETFVYYVTVTECDPDRVRSFAAEHGGVDEFRSIDTGGEESHWELVVRGPTITGLLADYGARMRSMIVDEGVSNAVVHVSPDVDVRDLVGAVTATYPETELRSKRTVERPVETSGDFRRRVQDELTDKQQTALEAAYYGGYFEWPTRTSDASEIADRLGIARQTFHQHLRVAQEKLFSAYFAE
ncbi:PAS domain S-box protein [Haloterrigena alkaliphila]|uniref:PAS domain S-box protein n=1 Tax=Haloterrigena alkaliphila TaxID=2816475 RepID=A0A8A2VDE2_9EURY|nr:PAS domain S-box protein [Haloterrigena alkaliphila]QSW98454.1 PAS domain S-box protein [Haloterrigena alkaliphila]